MTVEPVPTEPSPSRFAPHPVDPIALVGGVLALLAGLLGLLHQLGIIYLGFTRTLVIALITGGLVASSLTAVMVRRRPWTVGDEEPT